MCIKNHFLGNNLPITFDFEKQDIELEKFIAQKTKEIAHGPYQSTHNTGGTNMGNDPKTSVVNNYLEMWDAENVFICGALAYRTAEGVGKYLQKGGPLV